MIQSSVVFVGVSKGFGKTIGDIPPDNLVQVQEVCQLLQIDSFACVLTGSGLICERHPLYHYPLADKMLRCVPIPPVVTGQEPQTDVERDLSGFNCIDRHIHIHCRSAL